MINAFKYSINVFKHIMKGRYKEERKLYGTIKK